MSDTYYVALDLGTNSVIMLTVRYKDQCQFETVDEQIRMPRIGEDVAYNGSMKPEAMDRTLDAVADVLASVTEWTEHGTAVAAATSAVRDADNKHVFLEKFHHRFGAKPYIISGDEEARTTFLGATSDQPDAQAALTLDIGGGSTEFGIGHKGWCQRAESLSIGCVNLTEQFGLDEPASSEQVTEAYEHAKQEVGPIREHVANDLTGKPAVLVSGGTATTYAAYAMNVEPYHHEKIRGFSSTSQDVDRSLEWMRQKSVAERAAESGISEERAPLFPAGLIILRAVLAEVGIDTFSVTPRGLRFGLLVRMCQDELSPTWSW